MNSVMNDSRVKTESRNSLTVWHNEQRQTLSRLSFVCRPSWHALSLNAVAVPLLRRRRRSKLDVSTCVLIHLLIVGRLSLSTTGASDLLMLQLSRHMNFV